MSHPHLNCVDMSNWGGPLTAEEVACLRAEGVRKVIVGTGAPNGAGAWARQQASMALNHGLAVDAYVYLYFAKAPAAAVRIAMGTLQGLPIGRWWLDAEADEEGVSPQQRVTALSVCLDILATAHQATGIYTRRSWWLPYTGDTRVFAHEPLWNAWFDGDPDTDGLPYGGWSDSLIEQYQGTTLVCGQSVDLNFDKSLEDDMDEATTRRIVREELARVLDLEDLAQDDDDRLRLGMSASLGLIRLSTEPKVEDREAALAGARKALEEARQARGGQG